jgi:hypothetical protein
MEFPGEFTASEDAIELLLFNSPTATLPLSSTTNCAFTAPKHDAIISIVRNVFFIELDS